MNANYYWGLVKDAAGEWSADRAPRLGAALAYYTVFSMGPLLLIVLAVASMIWGEQAAQGQIVDEIKNTVGESVAEAIQQILKNNRNPTDGITATVIGVFTLLIGASGVFLELQDSLNTIWRVTPKPGRLFITIVRERLLSFAAVLGVGFLLLVSLVLSASLSAVAKFWTPAVGSAGIWVSQVLNEAISFGIITLLFALINKELPDVEISWRDVWLGAAVTSLLFTVGKFLLGLYLAQSSTVSAFGAAGSLAVILIWVYYSAQILLFGAELIRVHTRRRGAVIIPSVNAEPVEQSPTVHSEAAVRKEREAGFRSNVAAQADSR